MICSVQLVSIRIHCCMLQNSLQCYCIRLQYVCLYYFLHLPLTYLMKKICYTYSKLNFFFA